MFAVVVRAPDHYPFATNSAQQPTLEGFVACVVEFPVQSSDGVLDLHRNLPSIRGGADPNC